MAGTWCRPAVRAQPAAGRKQGRLDLFSSFWAGGGPGRAMRLLLPLILLLLPPAQAATYNVNPDGSGDYTTIPPALTAASSGDTIIVHGGTYPGFSVGKDGITLIGEGSPQITGGVGLNNRNRFISCIRNSNG
jgi:pectin methylesterase-like acyl-CoA thioesterase